MGVTNVQNTTTAPQRNASQGWNTQKTGLERFTCITVYLIEYKKKQLHRPNKSTIFTAHTQNITIKKTMKKATNLSYF